MRDKLQIMLLFQENEETSFGGVKEKDIGDRIELLGKTDSYELFLKSQDKMDYSLFWEEDKRIRKLIREELEEEIEKVKYVLNNSEDFDYYLANNNNFSKYNFSKEIRANNLNKFLKIELKEGIYDAIKEFTEDESKKFKTQKEFLSTFIDNPYYIENKNVIKRGINSSLSGRASLFSGYSILAKLLKNPQLKNYLKKNKANSFYVVEGSLCLPLNCEKYIPKALRDLVKKDDLCLSVLQVGSVKGSNKYYIKDPIKNKTIEILKDRKDNFDILDFYLYFSILQKEGQISKDVNLDKKRLITFNDIELKVCNKSKSLIEDIIKKYQSNDLEKYEVVKNHLLEILKNDYSDTDSKTLIDVSLLLADDAGIEKADKKAFVKDMLLSYLNLDTLDNPLGLLLANIEHLRKILALSSEKELSKEEIEEILSQDQEDEDAKIDKLVDTILDKLTDKIEKGEAIVDVNLEAEIERFITGEFSKEDVALKVRDGLSKFRTAPIKVGEIETVIYHL